MKSLFILLILTLSYQTYSQSIKRTHFATDLKCDNCGCIFDGQLKQIGDLLFKGTHGGSYPANCVSAYAECRLTLDAATSANGTKANAGFLISYTFKQNYRYDVYIFASGVNSAYNYGPSNNPPGIYPAMSAQLTNGQPGLPDPCKRNVYLPSAPTSNPYFGSFPHFTVTPQICYSDLWVVTEPNPAECERCSVIFDSVRIDESLPDVSIVPRSSDPAAICSSNEYRVFINGAEPPPNSISWTISNISPTAGVIVNSVINGNSIMLNKVSTGIIQLSASLISNLCGSPPITATQIITVGIPNPPSLNATRWYGNEAVLAVNNAKIGSSFNWYENGILTQANGSSSNTFIVYCGYSNKIQVGVEAANQCGISAKTKILLVNTCTAGQRLSDSTILNQDIDNEKIDNTSLETISVYPNPAVNSVAVLIPKSKWPKTYIKLYDLSGKLLRNIIPVSTTTNINIGVLASGTYIVEIFDGTNSIKKKIIKN